MDNTSVYLEEVRRRRRSAIAAISRIPIAVLVWGPAPSAETPYARTRLAVRERLRSLGHVAHFSEELPDESSGLSIHAIQAVDVEAHDLVIAIPASPGSIAEIHDFFKLPHLAGKIYTFVDQGWADGYSARSLLELRSNATAEVELYDASKLPGCIVDKAVNLVQRLQELHYILGRRA